VPINQKSLRDLKEHFLKDKHLLSKLGNLDDEFIEALLNLLYVESHSFVYYPINLLASLQSNPVLECKILDALFFILKQQIGIQDLKQACNFRDEQFPPSFIVQRYTILHDPTKTYENVSLKILYLFSKLPQNSIQYFYELASKKQLQSIQKL
jgi:E3 ubiquitin-protein ligase HUWE1